MGILRSSRSSVDAGRPEPRPIGARRPVRSVAAAVAVLLVSGIGPAPAAASVVPAPPGAAATGAAHAPGSTGDARAARPVGTPGDTGSIREIETSTAGGWRFTTYRNLAYPCAISGYQTFTIATRLGSDPDAVAPLWVHLHGGGIGWFSPSGMPRPGVGQKTEESHATQRAGVHAGELQARVREHPAGFRMMAVSMCNHDIYAGGDVPDPNNPNVTPDGRPRTVNGLFATKAAVQHALTILPTDDYLLYGTSAGSYGSFHVGWGLAQMGIPPTAIVADSGVMNMPWHDATWSMPGCGRPDEARVEIPRRLHPDVVAPANDPSLLVGSGRLPTPVLDVFSIGDPGQCGEQEIECPLGADTVTMGAVDCMHEPLRRAIEAEGPSSRSVSMRLCVRFPGEPPGSCATHTPTRKPLVNSIGPWPSDYHRAVLDWAVERLDDDGDALPPVDGPDVAFVLAALTDLLGGATPARAEAEVHALRAGLSPASLLGRLTRSREWLTAVVDDLYHDTLGRPGDAAGVAFWVGELASGRRTVAGVAASFYASPEYVDGLGGGTVASWVTDLYDVLLGRAPEPAGLAYWTDAARTRGRTWVAHALFQSSESAGERVDGLYRALLGRGASGADAAYWGPRVVAEGDLALARSLAASAEYRARAVVRFPPD